MDIVTRAKDLATFLMLFLSYLTKACEAAGAARNKFGEQTWNYTRALWESLRPTGSVGYA